MENVAKIFNDDVREKKRIGSGIFSRTGTRGYVGTMRFPSDLMTRKEKYNYRKSGKVKVYNMYDSIIPLDEFRGLTGQEKKKALEHWLFDRKYSKADIRKSMIVSSNTLDNWIKNMGIQYGELSKDVQDVQNIIPYKEFSTLPTEEKQSLIDTWINNGHALKEIENGMGIKSGTFSYYMKKFGLTYKKPYKERNKPKPMTRKPSLESKSKPKQEPKPAAAPPVEHTYYPPAPAVEPTEVYRVAEVVPNGLNLLFNDTMDASELMRRLKKIGLLVEDEPNKYKVNIRIEEVK